MPGLWGGGRQDELGSVSSVVGALSGAASLLWCAMLGRRWSLFRLRGILSSDLFKAGSFARHALPANGPEYATSSEKSAVQALGRTYGCHHCGRRVDRDAQHLRAMSLQRQSSQSSLQRHVLQTYNSSTSRNDSKLNSALDELPAVLGYVADHIPPSGLRHFKWIRWRSSKQLFYPQCPPCSNMQSQAVRRNRRTLVTPHWRRLTSSDFYPPPLLLLLYFAPALKHIVDNANIAV